LLNTRSPQPTSAWCAGQVGRHSTIQIPTVGSRRSESYKFQKALLGTLHVLARVCNRSSQYERAELASKVV